MKKLLLKGIFILVPLIFTTLALAIDEEAGIDDTADPIFESIDPSNISDSELFWKIIAKHYRIEENGVQQFGERFVFEIANHYGITYEELEYSFYGSVPFELTPKEQKTLEEIIRKSTLRRNIYMAKAIYGTPAIYGIPANAPPIYGFNNPTSFLTNPSSVLNQVPPPFYGATPKEITEVAKIVRDAKLREANQ